MSAGTSQPPQPSIAVLIPCLNEAPTIGEVVRDFRRELPDARIIVGDNNSDDATARIAAAAGAEVVHVSLKGKGAVLRSLFRDVDADLYVLVDGDSTYPADHVHELIGPVLEGRADMAVGDRRAGGAYDRENQRPMHGFGNRLVVSLINFLFGCRLNDILSGYRVMSRRFVENCPILVDGFTVETTITLHALDKRFVILEVPVAYRDRPPGSESKLSTYRDGVLVLRTILWIFKDNKPLLFFLLVSLLFGMAGVILMAVAGANALGLGGLFILAALIFLVCGFVLDTMVKLQRESFEVGVIRASRPREDA